MTLNETDLPCSACGGDLQIQTADVTDLPIEADVREPGIPVALCTGCSERHYPVDALLTLHQALDQPGGSA